MEEQVATIFAVGQGFMDDLPVEQIQRFERELIDALRAMPSVALKAIKETGALDDSTAATLKEEIAKFKRDLWKPGAAPREPAKEEGPGQTKAPAAPAKEEGAEEAEAPAPESGKAPVH
jgi:F-type H+-transporting ATPase subunit alpha